MRILQLVQKPQRRGAEIFAFQLSHAFRNMGHEVRTGYLYPYAGESPLEVLPDDRVLGGEEKHPFEVALGHHPVLLRRVDRLIDETRPDIIQLNGARTVKYGALSKRRRAAAPWRLIYRNIDNPAYWTRDRLRLWFYRNRVFPQIDGTIGVSQMTLDEVIRMYRLRTPSVFIPNGIDPVPLREAPTRSKARRTLEVGEDIPLLLFMGNLTEQKRPDRFLRVVAEVRRHLPEVQGWLLGRGPLEDTLRRRARTLGIEGAVRFCGYQQRVAPFIAACDLLVVTSDSDGIPAVVLEAGFLEKPTVATRVGGLHECVEDGVTGVLVDPADEPQLMAEVRGLLENPERRAALGSAAHTFVSDGFTIDVVARRYLDFYEKIASDR